MEGPGRYFDDSEQWNADMDAIDKAMETRIRCAIRSDEKESMISLIKSLSPNNKFYDDLEIWEEICQADALNCATALLEGELGRPFDVLIWDNLPLSLHYAANSTAPGLVKLLLSRGARTDVIFYDPEDVTGHNGLLPLGVALKKLSNCYWGQNSLAPIKSTFQLIAFLCLPKLKRSLEVCKLLAWSSKNVAEEAYYYAKEGKLNEFAILLMVAREKVLVPVTFSRRDGGGWNGSMMLHQYLKNEIVTLVGEEFNFPGSLVDRKKKMVLRSTILVLEVFERAGNAIEEYLQLEDRSPLQEIVEKDVALRLGEAGFTLKAGDFDFSITNWMNSHDSVRTPTKYLETPSESLSQPVHPRLSLLQQTNFTPRNGIIRGDGYCYSQPTYPLQKTCNFLWLGWNKAMDGRR